MRFSNTLAARRMESRETWERSSWTTSTSWENEISLRLAAWNSRSLGSGMGSSSDSSSSTPSKSSNSANMTRFAAGRMLKRMLESSSSSLQWTRVDFFFSFLRFFGDGVLGPSSVEHSPSPSASSMVVSLPLPDWRKKGFMPLRSIGGMRMEYGAAMPGNLV
ncbi:hypothetical protein M758_8G045400 [Ceratodon purpureus]|nr:hypothetical protein M758_8G045400 [Ceratodon purpureus]